MKPGRNDPCPCGSGAKYKRCCGANTPAHPAPDAGGEAQLRALLEQALGHHRAERFDQAETIYRRILDAHPDNGDALHLLGAIAHARGQHGEADGLVRKALSLHPGIAEFHNTHANVVRALGRLSEAVNSYRKALALKPDYADAHSNLGVALTGQGRIEEAAGHYRRAIEIDPSHALAHAHLGRALQALGRGEEAIVALRQAISLAPSSPVVWTAAGVTLLESGRIDDAIRCHRRALEIRPEYADAMLNLGGALAKREMPEEAMANYQRALQLQPRSANILANMGSLLESQGRLPEAIDCCRRAIEFDANSAGAYCNLGAAVKRLGRTEESLRYFERAIALEPSQVDAHWNRSLSLLSCGRLEEGWPEYEWGWKSGARKPLRLFPQPRWQGEPIEGKTILVPGEQGVGDEILFAGMLPDLVRRGARLVVECDARLVRLFERSFQRTEAVPRSNPPHPRTLGPGIDYYSPAGSLARFLRPDLGSFPLHRGYLKADPGRTAEFRARLGALGPGWKIGICWRSMLRTPTRLFEYTNIDQWGPILRAPGVHLVNLQYGECRQELEQAREMFGVPIHAFEDLNLKDDLDGAAALTDALDLVISAGTAVSAMAGALGKTVWLYHLATASDWVTFGTDSIPWFPSTRRFDCQHGQAWDEVIAQVATELFRLAAATPGGPGPASGAPVKELSGR